MEVHLSLLSLENAITKFFWNVMYYFDTGNKKPVQVSVAVNNVVWIGNSYFAVWIDVNKKIVLIPISIGDYERNIKEVTVTYVLGKIKEGVYLKKNPAP